jgi:lysophospholipase L1-like esterase
VRISLRGLAVLATLPLTVLLADVGHAAALPPATYLALGDSVAAGVGASRPELGYVPRVADALRSARQCSSGSTASCLGESIDLSVSGATTTTLIASQLPAATSLLQARNGNATPDDDVRLITLTIGGNDLFQPVIAACQNPTAPACSTTVATQLQQVATNLPTILGRLRAAAGRDTTIAVTTYYNGLAAPGCPAAALSQLAQVVLEGGPGVPAGLNDIIRQAAQASGAVVVETAPVVEPAEIRPDCLHPTDQGHADIAAAVARAVLSTVVGGGRTPAPAITVDTAVIDSGGTHQLTVTGRAGGAVQLLGNGRVIRTATIPASGQSTWTLQPRDRTVFQAAVDGVRSTSVEVRVRRAVSIGIRQPVTGVYVFSGTIDRPEAGVQVTVARLDSETRRVTGVASTRTTADGRYEISTSLPVGFAGYYALTSATAQVDAGRSRLYGLLVNTRPGQA